MDAEPLSTSINMEFTQTMMNLKAMTVEELFVGALVSIQEFNSFTQPFCLKPFKAIKLLLGELFDRKMISPVVMPSLLGIFDVGPDDVNHHTVVSYLTIMKDFCNERLTLSSVSIRSC